MRCREMLYIRKMGKLYVTPDGLSVELSPGESVLSHLQRMRVDISARCGGKGECGSCRIRVISEKNLSPATEKETSLVDIKTERLACEARVTDSSRDILIEIPARESFFILEKGLPVSFVKDPVVTVRTGETSRQAVRAGKELGQVPGRCTGIAVDVGTTTVVVRWYDLENNDLQRIATVSALNPQVRYGDNVIDRIRYAMAAPGGQQVLEETLFRTINDLIWIGPVSPDAIFDVVIVGNTVMRDLCAGCPVQALGSAPFSSVHPGPANIKTADRGLLTHPEASMYVPPVLGHFVGADMLAVLLAVGMDEREELSLAIDIGTNTEIALGNRDGILVTSCASGPAFEGSGVRCGTGAVEGAVSEVTVHADESVSYRTIGDRPPEGICGSGLIDAIAGMLEHDILDQDGKFTGGRARFVLAGKESSILPPLSLDGEDIDAVKLAKSAVATGIVTLIRKFSLSADDISAFYIAGAFGSSLNPAHARDIGLIPDIPADRVIRAGNAAIEGASMMLLSEGARRRGKRIAALSRHVSLEHEPGFEDLFVENLGFGRLVL
jgi:uncharacterized 2Fe-2S/4Fe-4S cluster protein (DUF4445 family)